ncbi:hypothetical protein ACFQJ7_14345 [Halovenus rubra]|uniref:Uncharacterized protein n=2 Tax=Halovenus rubra TaxID=869890 RepID=A0ACC7DYL7_9EURY|nr:hypothetical protein [Halovenus rubra]
MFERPDEAGTTIGVALVWEGLAEAIDEETVMTVGAMELIETEATTITAFLICAGCLCLWAVRYWADRAKSPAYWRTTV